MPEYRVREVRIEEFGDEVWFYPEILFHKTREVFGWYGCKGFRNWRESFYQKEKYTEWQMVFATGRVKNKWLYSAQAKIQLEDSCDEGNVVVFKDLESANSWIAQHEKEFAEWALERDKKLVNLFAITSSANDFGVSEKIYPIDSVVAKSYSSSEKVDSVVTELPKISSSSYPYYDFSTPPAEGENVIFRDIASHDASLVYMVTYHADQWDMPVLKTLRWCKIPEYKKDDSVGDKKDLVL